jgi:hypothetical protein
MLEPTDKKHVTSNWNSGTVKFIKFANNQTGTKQIFFYIAEIDTCSTSVHWRKVRNMSNVIIIQKAYTQSSVRQQRPRQMQSWVRCAVAAIICCCNPVQTRYTVLLVFKTSMGTTIQHGCETNHSTYSVVIICIRKNVIIATTNLLNDDHKQDLFQPCNIQLFKVGETDSLA